MDQIRNDVASVTPGLPDEAQDADLTIGSLHLRLWLCYKQVKSIEYQQAFPIGNIDKPEATTVMKRSNPRQRNREGETGQLVLRAAEAHHEAELARKQVRLAKAEYKKARKAFKKARKAARQARKLAKAASKVLRAQRAVKRRQSKKPQPAPPLQGKKKAAKPVTLATPSAEGAAGKAPPGSESTPPDISPPASA
jgi:hypothetical protein